MPLLENTPIVLWVVVAIVGYVLFRMAIHILLGVLLLGIGWMIIEHIDPSLAIAVRNLFGHLLARGLQWLEAFA